MNTDTKILKEVIEEIELSEQTPDQDWPKEELEKWMRAKVAVCLRRELFNQMLIGNFGPSGTTKL